MRQTILVAALIGILALTGWVWFRYVRETAPVAPVRSTAEESELLRQYRQLKHLETDTGIFSDPTFQSLERFRPALITPPLPAGRANPFAPF